MVKLKTSLLLTGSALIVSATSAYLFNGFAHGEWDLAGLNQQVQHVTEVTDNHEGRITNLENKVNTPTGQPTPTPVVVTQVVTQAAPQVAGTSTSVVVAPAADAPATVAPAPAPTPAPTVVSEKHEICLRNGVGPTTTGNVNIILRSYSDGSRQMFFADGTVWPAGYSCSLGGSW